MSLCCSWQYNSKYNSNFSSWSPSPSKFSFVRRRFWRRRILQLTRDDALQLTATSESTYNRPDSQLPIRVGWLLKRGKLNTAFKARYFVLWPKALIYYKEEPPIYDAKESAIQGVIPLKRALVRWEVGAEGQTLLMEIQNIQRKYILSAPKKDSTNKYDNIDDWFRAIDFTIAGRYDDAAAIPSNLPIDSRMRSTDHFEDFDSLKIRV